jgi:hypothetical protein
VFVKDLSLKAASVRLLNPVVPNLALAWTTRKSHTFVIVVAGGGTENKLSARGSVDPLWGARVKTGSVAYYITPDLSESAERCHEKIQF